MASILLTGSHGYLGERLFQVLNAPNHRITRLSHKPAGDSISYSDLTTTKTNFNVIIHAGTCYGRNGESEVQICEANVVLPNLLLDFAVQRSALFLNIDSVLRPDLNHYAATKREFRNCLNARIHENNYINLILDHFYGPGDAGSKFPTWLTRKLLFTKEQIPLSDGKQERNFIYIDDLVRTIVAMIDGTIDVRGLVRLQGPDTIRIRELATLIAELTGQDLTRLEFGKLPQRSTGSEVAPLEEGTKMLSPPPPTLGLTAGLGELIAAERKAQTLTRPL